MKKTFLAAAAALALAAPASAASFDFRAINLIDDPSISFSSDGIGLTVTAGTFGNANPSAIDFSTRNVDQDLIDGLGADGGLFESDEVDGLGGNDVLVFTFDTMVRIDRIFFSAFDVDSNDDFAFGTVAGNIFTRFTDFEDVATTVETIAFGGDALRDFAFGIGAIGNNDNFSIRGMEVSAVPVPAAGLLLLAGLGGLGALRRRKKAA